MAAAGVQAQPVATTKKKKKMSAATRAKLRQAGMRGREAQLQGGATGGTTTTNARPGSIENLLQGVTWTPQQVAASLTNYRRAVAILEAVQNQFHQQAQTFVGAETQQSGQQTGATCLQRTGAAGGGTSYQG
jgi:hypothetical protein